MNNLKLEYKLSLYDILTEINKNEKSEVYLVQHNQTDNIYIKKVLKNYNIEVFKNIEKLENIHIPYIHEFFEFEDKLILIEEFVNGSTLEDLLKEAKNISEIKTIEYALDICNVLKKLHSLDPPIIHRDIKPSNIIISNDGVLKLIDYDISRKYNKDGNCDTMIMGTQEYASPEHFGFSQTDCRSDIYSLGVLMNVLTTGSYPKYKKNQGFLKEIIEKCTNISPDNRYQSVEELEKDLEKIFVEIKELNINKQKNISNSFKGENKNVNKKISLRNFYQIIPGFRTHCIWKSILACFWYFILLIMLIGDSESSFFVDFVQVIFLVLITMLYTNFLDIKNHLPLINKNEIYMKILGYFIYTVILLAVGGIFMGK